jgi:hypothetical protein
MYYAQLDENGRVHTIQESSERINSPRAVQIDENDGWLTHPPTCGAFIEHEYFWLSFVVYVVIFVAVVVAIELWKRK